MKFVKGRTLKDVLKGIAANDTATVKDFPLSRLLTIFQKVCDAVAYAHSRRVIHRDLKPENIMVGAFGEVLVMDWGLAKILPKRSAKRIAHGAKRTEPKAPAYHVESARQEDGTEKTMSGAILGTPGYMAPEQAMGTIELLDERTDIYALGAILYSILTLRPPVEGKNLMDFLQKVTTGEIPHPSTHHAKARTSKTGRAAAVGTENKAAESPAPATTSVAPYRLVHLPGQRVPESLAAVAMKALSLAPENRYGSVADVQKEIEAYQNGFATGAEEARAWKQFLLLVRRNRAVFSTLAAMLLILITAMAAYTRVNVRERVKAQKALGAYESERTRRLGERKTSAPALVKTARLFLDQKAYEDALATLEIALEYDAGQPATHLLRVAVLRQLKRYPEALAACREYVEQFPNDPDAKKLLAICEQKDEPGPTVPQEMASLLRNQGCFVFAAEQLGSSQGRVELYKTQLEKVWPQGFNIYMTPDGEIVASLATLRDKLSDLAPLQGMIIHQLNLSYGKIRDLSPLKGMPLRSLNLSSCSAVTDVSPLRGMPLDTLNLYATAVKDLSPLKGMRLQSLNLLFTPAADLSPLKDMPLRVLNIGGIPCYVTDFSPLSGLPLETLELGVEGMRDISMLKGMKLKCLKLGRSPVRDISVLDGMPLEVFVSVSNPDLTDIRPLRNAPLRSVILTVQAVTQGMGDLRKISTLTTINDLAAAEFWKKYDAGEFRPR